MKKLILLSIMMLSVGFSLSAQKEDSKQKIEASKAAFITSYLNLTSAQATEFWPVYNEYKNKSSELRSRRRTDQKAEEMSDAEANIKLDDMVKADGERTALRKEYFAKFRKMLSAKKVLMLIEAESEFRKQMVRQYASRNSGPKGTPNK